MTDPDGTIEPVEGVKRRVALSKDLVATTTEDLKQYHHWLKDYLASEKRDRDRHMRRLRPPTSRRCRCSPYQFLQPVCCDSRNPFDRWSFGHHWVRLGAYE